MENYTQEYFYISQPFSSQLLELISTYKLHLEKNDWIKSKVLQYEKRFGNYNYPRLEVFFLKFYEMQVKRTFVRRFTGWKVQTGNHTCCYSREKELLKLTLWKSTSETFNSCRRNLRIWSHLLKKSLMENFVFCAVMTLNVEKNS